MCARVRQTNAKRKCYVRNLTAANSDEMGLQETVTDLAKAFFVDRRPRNTEKCSRRRFKVYGDVNPRSHFGRPLPVSGKPKFPWYVCTVCNKQGCRSLNHRRERRYMLKRFTQTYSAGADFEESGNKSQEDAGKDENDDEENV